MLRLQAKAQDDEGVSDADRPKRSNWMYLFLGGVASGLIPVLMSFGLIRQLQESVTLEVLLSIGVLAILIVLLFVLSARQRYNERTYLRAWKERQERQLALKQQRQLEALGRTARHSHRNTQSDQADWEGDDEQPSMIETRLLRSIGLEPPS